MASTINALSTGSGGLVSTGDASGQLELQANGSTKLTVSSSGVNMSGLAFPTTDGTNGQVLQTNGSGTLSFATPAGGSWTYLSTVTASNSATLDIETTIDSTYDTYAIVMSGLVPTGNGVTTKVRFKVSGTYQSANYRFIVTNLNSATGGSGGFDCSVGNAGDSMTINTSVVATSASSSMSGIIYLARPSSTALFKQIYGQTTSLDSNVIQSTFSGAYTASTTAVTGVQIYFSSGNVSSGSVRLYGIKNS